MEFGQLNYYFIHYLKPKNVKLFFFFLPGEKYRFEEITLCLRTETRLCSNKLLHVA